MLDGVCLVVLYQCRDRPEGVLINVEAKGTAPDVILEKVPASPVNNLLVGFQKVACM